MQRPACRLRVIITSLKPRLYYCLQFFFSLYILLRGASAVGRAYIRARRSRRGRWCRFLRGIVPWTGRTWGVNLPRLSATMHEVPADAPSPRTYIHREREREISYPTHTRAHVDTVSSWIWPRATFRAWHTGRREPYQTTQYEARSPFITRLWALSHDTCRLREPVLHRQDKHTYILVRKDILTNVRNCLFCLFYCLCFFIY